MKSSVLALITTLVVGGCTDSQPEIAVDQELADVAYHLCPILWQWQLAMGGTMNDMSHAAFRDNTASGRLVIYLDAMEMARDNLDFLRDRLNELPDDRFQQFFRREIEEGLVQAETAINQAEASVEEQYDIVGEPTYHEIVPSLFLSFEKVIDLAKPELASYGDPDLIPAFQTVPQCQHGVKDADDGVPRHVPLEPGPKEQ